MTGVPAPRGAEQGGGGQEETTTVLGILVATTRRIEDTVARGFDNVNQQLARLPEQYVARREFDRYRDELSLDWQSAVHKHDKDIDDLKTEARDRAAQVASFRRWLIATGSATTIGVAGVVTGVINHFH